NFPTANALRPALRGGSDAFVTKLNAAGSTLIYSTYLGGTGSENQTGNPRAGGIAVDASGNAYVTGNTDSTDFPIANALQPTAAGSAGDAKCSVRCALFGPDGKRGHGCLASAGTRGGQRGVACATVRPGTEHGQGAAACCGGERVRLEAGIIAWRG